MHQQNDGQMTPNIPDWSSGAIDNNGKELSKTEDEFEELYLSVSSLDIWETCSKQSKLK